MPRPPINALRLARLLEIAPDNIRFHKNSSGLPIVSSGRALSWPDQMRVAALVYLQRLGVSPRSASQLLAHPKVFSAMDALNGDESGPLPWVVAWNGSFTFTPVTSPEKDDFLRFTAAVYAGKAEFIADIVADPEFEPAIVVSLETVALKLKALIDGGAE